MSEVFGIDVSHHNGTIDWQKVAASGIKFAVMKCQYEAASHNIDEQFENNYKGCSENGIAKGVYIYIARASMNDPEADAKALLAKLNGRPLEYGIWLDLEDSSLGAKGKAYIRELAFTYADIFMQAGYYVGIYCNLDWYSRLIHQDLKDNFDFWIARYPFADKGVYNSTSSLKPSENIAVAWQYSSKGKVDGISGNVDLDVDYDGVIELIAHSEVANNTTEIANPYTEPTELIKRGSRGEGVKWVQWHLVRLGYSIGEIDGIFGQKTYSAVCLFQKAYGNITIDGKVGPQTRAALKKA